MTTTKTEIRDPGLDTGTVFMVIGKNVWGKGGTIEAARKAAGIRKQDRHLVYVVGAGATVTNAGDIATPADEPTPILTSRWVHGHKQASLT